MTTCDHTNPDIDRYYIIEIEVNVDHGHDFQIHDGEVIEWETRCRVCGGPVDVVLEDGTIGNQWHQLTREPSQGRNPNAALTAVLSILQGDPAWSADTLDHLSTALKAAGYADNDANGVFAASVEPS